MSGKIFLLAVSGVLALSINASAQIDSNCVECVAAASGTVIVPLRCEGSRAMLLGDNMLRGQTTVVNGVTPGTQTAGFKVVGDDEDLVKICGASAMLSFDLTPNQPGHIVSTSPGQTTTLTPTNYQFWTGTGSDINTAVQTITGIGNPHGLDYNESPGNGSRFFYVGASFMPAADQQRGRYEGTVTFDVQYF